VYSKCIGREIGVWVDSTACGSFASGVAMPIILTHLAYEGEFEVEDFCPNQNVNCNKNKDNNPY